MRYGLGSMTHDDEEKIGTMIDQIISHYTILSKIGEGGMFQISPRTQFVSGWRFENPPQRSVGGGVI